MNQCQEKNGGGKLATEGTEFAEIQLESRYRGAKGQRHTGTKRWNLTAFSFLDTDFADYADLLAGFAYLTGAFFGASTT